MKAYITAASTISPVSVSVSGRIMPTEKSFDEPFMFDELCASDYIDSRTSRRMSRIMKAGLAGALMCLEKSVVKMPDAIITGTGFGCLEDTAAFMGKLSHAEGLFLNPTAFIQSTHNTIAGTIALHLKCHGDNNTFSQLGFSFESALIDTLLLLHEKKANHVLLGGFDENIGFLTDTLHSFRSLRKSSVKMVALGEGVSFFMLSESPVGETPVKISFRSVNNRNMNDVLPVVNEMIKESGEPCLILTGTNGDELNDRSYQSLYDYLNRIQVVEYKKYCGEYPTAPAFAHWLATHILTLGGSQFNNPERILVYNHSRGKNHSFTMFSK